MFVELITESWFTSSLWNINKCLLFVFDDIFIFQALDTFNTAIVSPIYYVMFTSLTILASVIMFKVWKIYLCVIQVVSVCLNIRRITKACIGIVTTNL